MKEDEHEGKCDCSSCDGCGGNELTIEEIIEGNHVLLHSLIAILKEKKIITDADLAEKVDAFGGESEDDEGDADGPTESDEISDEKDTED